MKHYKYSLTFELKRKKENTHTNRSWFIMKKIFLNNLIETTIGRSNRTASDGTTAQRAVHVSSQPQVNAGLVVSVAALHEAPTLVAALVILQADRARLQRRRFAREGYRCDAGFALSTQRLRLRLRSCTYCLLWRRRRRRRQSSSLATIAPPCDHICHY